MTGDDLAAVGGRPPWELITALEEALAAKVLVDEGGVLAFRHPGLRSALTTDLPAPRRSNLCIPSGQMDSGRRLRAGRACPRVTTHGGHEEQSGVRVHLFDLDVGQMREQLLDGVTRPDND
ncbi:hypothetical protein [Actinoplanes sp. NPDC089786]|uniref:hypothetical protein n=1 Tax=Actinoplanes sp. NPDC089786 TaxID=3155185 RepID=UPI003424B351